MTNEQHEPPGVPPVSAAPAAWQSRWRRGLTATIILYSLAIALLWIWIRFEGDRSWLATLFLFGPRWLCALPLLVLAPLAAVWRRRMLWLLALAGLLIVFTILDFQVHWSSASAPYRLRVLTCNVNQMNIRLEALAELIDRLNPDVVALQEVPYNPPPLAWPQGWQVVHFDKLLVASRHPLERREFIMCPTEPGKPLAARFLVKMGSDEVQFFNLHLMTPREGLTAVLDAHWGLDLSGVPKLKEILRLRSEESQFASHWITSFPGAKVVAGDFNMPADSLIFRENWSWLEDAFSSAGFGLGYTKRTGPDRWTYGARIDHILYSPPWQCVRAWVEADIGSDHLPLLADFE